MRKRIALLVGVALILSAAPDAFADHCWRCRYFPRLGEVACVTVNSTTIGGWTICEEDGTGGCSVSGEECAPHTAAFVPPLASEYTVVAVERLDEPRTAADETLVASAVANRPAIR